MIPFCQDRDLLGIEPVVFIGQSLPSQQLAAGNNGRLAGLFFTASDGDFLSAGVKEGMVLCVWTTTSSEGYACEIVSVDSATQLTVSVLRADETAAPVAPSPGENLSFCVRTYGPQIQNVSVALAEKLRRMREVEGVRAADFADSRQLRLPSFRRARARVGAAQALRGDV